MSIHYTIMIKARSSAKLGCSKSSSQFDCTQFCFVFFSLIMEHSMHVCTLHFLILHLKVHACMQHNVNMLLA